MLRINGRTRIGCGLLAGVAACLLAPSVATATDCGLPGSPGTGMSPVLDVQGDLASARTGGYLQIPFQVDPGATAIQVRYSYDQADGGCSGPNTLDMGVYQPKSDPSSAAYEQTDRRGWSGSAVKNLAIAENGFTDETTYNANRKAFVNGFTTRAYQPGPIQAGAWAVELGIAYVDPSDTDGIHYHVQVLQSSDPVWSSDPYSPSGPPDETINSTPGWYTGDLHVHGEQEPGNATMTETFAAAFGPSGAGLDFVTLVDHNNNVAHDDMRTQADVYPDDLVIPGTEVTTYRGHWNNEGSSNFADFRGGPVYALSDAATPPYDDSDLTHVQNATRPKKQFKGALDGGGWTQVNHPAYFRDNPSACRGCAWSYSDEDTGFKRLDAIEISQLDRRPAGEPAVHRRRDRLLRARARQRRPHRGGRFERRPQGGHGPDLAGRPGRHGRPRRGAEQARHHRGRQGRSHLREAVRDQRARRLARGEDRCRRARAIIGDTVAGGRGEAEAHRSAA